MTFRKQTLLIILITLICPISLLYGIALHITLKSYATIEQQDTRKHVERVRDTLADDFESLRGTAEDWSSWDDAYTFMENRNPVFIKSNVVDQTFERMRLNFMIFIDPSGKMVYGKGFDLVQEKEMPIPESILKQALPIPVIQNPELNKQAKSLSVLTSPGNHPLTIVGLPILTSENKGPSRGTLIFARYLDDNAIKHLSEITHLSLTIKRFDEPQLPDDFAAIHSGLLNQQLNQSSIVIQPLSDDVIAGYTLIKDVYGKPALIMRVDVPREIYKQAQANLSYLLISLLIVGLVFGTVFGIVANSLLKKLDQYLNELKQSQQELFTAKELAEITLFSIGDAVITTNAKGEVEKINPIAEQLTGWQIDEARGQPLIEVFKIINEQTREPAINPVETVLREGIIAALANHTILLHRDGREFAIDDSAAPIRTKEGEIVGTVLVFRDVTSDRLMENLLSWEASHDDLTNLVNRREFERCLKQALAIAKTQDKQHILGFLDLDRFKVVNDTCGHVAGDELLCQLANLMQAKLRKADTLARLGGDEFGIILHECPMEKGRSIIEDLSKSIQDFGFVWEDKVFRVGVSIGLLTITANSQNVENIMEAVDAACYAAKESGWNNIRIYESDDNELSEHRQQRQWLSQINLALAENHFRLYYQSIVSLNGSKPTEDIAHTLREGKHYEILLRMIDDQGKVIAPMAFIPTAERYKLMPAIDRWVISTLFTMLDDHFQQANIDTSATQIDYLPHYAVNLSGASINEADFIEFMREQFAVHKIPPQIICFEITETVAIANLSKATQLMKEFKGMGCKFALDDFGSGMSSFTYLKTLPVDYLKIDGSFVKDIVNDSVAEAIVGSINTIAQEMGIQTIAEFVASEAILVKIRDLGVDYAQGYSIDKPQLLVL
jgi:diguanylate cyclase (GGDEF)-like protein/PAS domain S-box-containing protein